MTSVLEMITKLPRYVKILSTNGIDENTAIVLDDKKERRRIYDHNFYLIHRERILARKKIYNARPEVKKNSSEYHRTNRLKWKSKSKK